MQSFVVLVSMLFERVHKGLGKKEKIHFQNSVNTIKKRHNWIWISTYTSTWKKSKICSGLFAYLFLCQ